MTTYLIFQPSTGAILDTAARDEWSGCRLNHDRSVATTELYTGSQTNISQLADVDPWAAFKAAREAYLLATDKRETQRLAILANGGTVPTDCATICALRQQLRDAPDSNLTPAEALALIPTA